MATKPDLRKLTDKQLAAMADKLGRERDTVRDRQLAVQAEITRRGENGGDR